jgi:bifunctional aspartokinase / homoserine dehydrogenase 1
MLRVLKFGGTSVGDAPCIRRVVDIVNASSRVSEVVVVVSAISGVTNQLVKAASEAANGDVDQVAAIFNQLHDQHHAALEQLISTPQECERVGRIIDNLLEEGTRLCHGTHLLRELTPRANDAITSLGERLSVPLVAAGLKQRGVATEALEATELIVTDSSYGSADPWLDLTRERCKSRLLPLLKDGVVPVVTGFIGATTDGILTTLGRGGSDYSATILGAALDADEVVIWTDVDGFLTADPRIVPDACTIAEISYREASELAFFGAKVLHPKTLRPLVQRGIPLWIRNTFAPEKPGTKITQTGAANGTGVTALTAFADAALVTVGGPGIAGVPDVLGRSLAITRELRTDVLLVSQSSSENEICLVVPSSTAKLTVEELRREFAQDLAFEKVEHIAVDSTVAVVTVVGQKMRGMSGVVGRTFCALARANVDTVATAHGASDCKFSFVVAKKDMHSALTSIHREFQLGTLSSDAAAKSAFTPQPCSLTPSVESCSLSAD